MYCFFRHHTFAVVFIVRAFNNLGLVEVFVDEAIVVRVVSVLATTLDVSDESLSALVSGLSRASSNALTFFNLSSPHACFRNS